MACASRVAPPLSAMDMLRESSTSTAMMFCCGLSSATRMAGCHNKSRTSAASANWSSQMMPALQSLTCVAASGNFERISQASPAPAANTKRTKTHHGQEPSSTRVPFEKTARGYLKKNSNMTVSYDAISLKQESPLAKDGPAHGKPLVTQASACGFSAQLQIQTPQAEACAACACENYSLARFAARSSPLVRHSVHHVIDPQTKRQRCELLRIARIIGPFPGVPQVHVVADRDHHAAPVIPDRAPFRDVAVLLVRSAGADVLLPRHLETLGQIVQDMKNFVFVG